MGRRLGDRIDAIKTLASLAQDNEICRKYILQEEGVPPLIKLLKESDSLNVQIAAAEALSTLTDDPGIMKNIVDVVIVRLLKETRIELYGATQYDTVIWSLVTLLSSSPCDSQVYSLLKHELRIRCAEALWTLAARSVSNCWAITKTKAMLCLAMLVEEERGRLQYYCLTTIMMITAVAESDIHFRNAVFKTNSPSAKAVVGQLLRVIKESDKSVSQIPAVRSIGSLARFFPSRQTRVISLLVSLLNSKHLTVASEAAIALKKFTSPQNYLCLEHWITVMEFISLPVLVRFIVGSNKMKWDRCDRLIIFTFSLSTGIYEVLVH